MLNSHPEPLLEITVATYFTDEGLVLVAVNAIEAQRAYLKGQMQGLQVKLDGDKVIVALPKN